MASILLVDDDGETAFIIRSTLEPTHQIEVETSLLKAKERLTQGKFSLLLLDVALPDGNGIEWYSEVQSSSPQMPVIFLTAGTDIADQALGISLGADDYLIKPIHPIILRVRIDACLKRHADIKVRDDVFILGDLTFQVAKQLCFVVREKERQPIELTPLEFKLLLHFAKNEEIVLTRDQLMNGVWGRDIHIYDRTIDTHVSRLRRKLKPSRYTLEAVHGVGYRMVVAHDGKVSDDL